MDEQGDSSLPSLPEDVDVLKSTIGDLRRRELQLVQEKRDAESEFGKKRAMLKGLFVSKEEELESLRKQLQTSQSEMEETRTYLKGVVSECDTLRAATSVMEDAQREELGLVHKKCQEEIASLQHIMREAVQEARMTTGQQFELERHSLLSANQKLEAQIKELQGKSGQEGKSSGVMSAMSDAMVGVVRRNTSQASSSGQSKDKDANTLEERMKKAQEDADAWKAIVRPLEEELASFKAKLKHAEERAQSAEVKLKTLEKETKKAESASSSQNLEELQERVKELSQYLDSERSSRTDLEMFVAVLNTQKGVLQEDSDKLRKEVHNVCRILEEEKTAHRELKKTWQMANDHFLENQQMQNSKLNLMWGIMNKEQRAQVIEERKHMKPHTGQLIDLSSPTLTPVTSVENATDTALSLPDAGAHLSESLSFTNSFTSIEASDREGSNDEDEEDGTNENARQRSHSASDTGDLDVNFDVTRAKSADDLNTGSSPPISVHENADAAAIRQNPLLDFEPRPRTPSKGGRIDWRVFQEEVKVSHQSEMNRSCVMCNNYEKQLQNVEAERQKYKNLSSNLQIALEQEKKALFEEQRLRSRLEESVAHAGQDAQTQINEQAKVMDKFDKILLDVQRNYVACKKEAVAQIEKLTASRNELNEELNRLRSEYSALQDSALAQLTKTDSDSRLIEMREQMMQIRTASEGTEDKLRSEIAFLKERAIAEQMNKDSMEEMLLADADTYKSEIGQLSAQLKKEKKQKLEAETKTQQSDQTLRNIETKSKQVIIALRGQLEEASEEKKKIEEEIKRFKNQLQSLTSQLNESETVQRDFVKLSQSLQMRIVKLQESEQDVRWEHKDDVHKCNKCKKPFNSNKDKYHCHHCGKIFCETCRSKSFSSSVTRRSHQVCDLCHAMLSNDSKALANDHLSENS